jgi:hypothetical protein
VGHGAREGRDRLSPPPPGSGLLTLDAPAARAPRQELSGWPSSRGNGHADQRRAVLVGGRRNTTRQLNSDHRGRCSNLLPGNACRQPRRRLPRAEGPRSTIGRPLLTLTTPGGTNDVGSGRLAERLGHRAPGWISPARSSRAGLKAELRGGGATSDAQLG